VIIVVQSHSSTVFVASQSDPRIDVTGSSGVQLNIPILIWFLHSGINRFSTRRLNTHTHKQTYTMGHKNSTIRMEISLLSFFLENLV